MRRSIVAGGTPKTFGEIKADVVNDYGTTTTRSIHRHIERAIRRGVIVKLLRPGSGKALYSHAEARFLRDPDNLLELGAVRPEPQLTLTVDGRVHAFLRDVQVGTALDAGLRLMDPCVAARHFVIEGGVLRVVDQTRPVTVNGVGVAGSVALHSGDVIVVGESELVVGLA